MSKKSDSSYFQNFIECVECGCQAAKMLEDNLNHFDTGLLQDKLDELHRIEHDADKKKHEMMAVLVKAFITPIEREDILELMQELDDYAKENEMASVSLEVRQSNLSAQQLYEKSGFEVVGKRRNFYVNPTEDALIMTKTYGGLF